MNWQDVKDAIAKHGPEVEGLLEMASLIPGAGAVTGPAAVAVKALSKAFGTDATPDALVAAIQADPGAALKLQQAVLDHQVEMTKQENEALRMQLDDIKGARTMRTDHEKITGKGDLNLYILAWVVVFGFFGLVFALLNIELPKDQNGVIFMLFGSLATGFGQVLQFFFGSSKGSNEKTQLLAAAEPIKQGGK